MAYPATSCIFIAVTLLCVALQASATPVRAVPPPIVADRPHHIVPALASVGKGLPEHMSCDSCQEIVGTAINLTESSTGRAIVTGIIDSLCKKELPASNETKLLALCEALGKDLVDAVPKIDSLLAGLAWDVPYGFCSVFIPVCSQPCCSADTPTLPEQRHLSLTHNSTEMAITWVTLQSTTTSTVQWGPATTAAGKPATANDLPFSSNGAANTRTYTNGGWIGVIHTAIMTHLQPGKQYTYRVGDSAGGWSSLATFSTLPSDIGSKAHPLRMIQVGDMGFGDASNETIASITALVDEQDFDIMLHVGDVGYADGYESHWGDFLRKVDPIASRVPYMTTPGNHELWFNFSAYRHLFWMPTPVAGQVRPPASDTSMYYSVDIGPLHLIMYNTETWYDTPNLDDAQRAWMKADLASAVANRAAQPWIIGAGHRPLYCSNHGIQCGLFAGWLRYLLEDEFYGSGVDLVVQCHEHSMERSLPMYKGKVVQSNYTKPTAPVYVVNGAGGNREGNADPQAEDWVAFRSADRGFGRITITGASELQYQFVQNNGTVLDEFTITK